MHGFIAWVGFLGAWLLVAGPVYQASLELRAEDVEIGRIRELTTTVPPPPPISNWWWLLPPVRYWLEHRRSDVHRHLIVDAMRDDDYISLTQFMNKAWGWLLVGAGGFAIAAKETYELVEHYEWEIAWFWVLVVLMTALSIGQTVARTSRSERELAARDARARTGGQGAAATAPSE
jgi:hypothetical protein